MRKKKKILSKFANFASAVAVGLCVGCASPRLKPLPTVDVESCEIHVVNKEYSFGIEPYESWVENENVFLEKLPTKGILPLLYVCQNNQSSGIVVFYGYQNTTFRDVSGLEWDPIAGEEGAREFYHKAGMEQSIAFRIGGIIPAAIVGDCATKKNIALSSDLQSKELPRQIVLQPGEVRSGFIYFNRPKKSFSREKDFFKAINGGTLETKVFIWEKGIQDLSFVIGQDKKERNETESYRN
jgi:hypothetical protein